MTKIKICGLKRIEDAKYVNEAMPDYAGFVFWDKSKRNVSADEAMAIREVLDDKIITVGVFVDMEPSTIKMLVDRKIISVVQLHGKETEEDIKNLRTNLGKDVMIIKAFEVSDVAGVKRANASSADMVLIDSGKGSGSTFDWNLLKEINRDYFLAGGLSKANVGEAVNMLKPYAVDVSSKVETDGVKDRIKINDFCEAVRKVQ